MASREHAAIIARAIDQRKLRNQTVKAAKNPAAKFEARAEGDEKRRCDRGNMRKLRAARRSQKKSKGAKPRQRKPGTGWSGAAKPTQRHIRVKSSKRCSGPRNDRECTGYW